MPYRATIPITDHGDVGVCTMQYNVRHRPSGTTPWITSLPQYDTPVLIDGLIFDASYDYEITRQCCDGAVSTAASGTFTVL